MAVDCFRFFNFRTFDEVDRLTIPEYHILIEANQLRYVDKRLLIHEQAWANQMVKATTKVGFSYESAFPTFRDFYDYDAEKEAVMSGKAKVKEPKIERFARYMKKKGGK